MLFKQKLIQALKCEKVRLNYDQQSSSKSAIHSKHTRKIKKLFDRTSYATEGIICKFICKKANKQKIVRISDLGPHKFYVFLSFVVGNSFCSYTISNKLVSYSFCDLALPGTYQSKQIENLTEEEKFDILITESNFISDFFDPEFIKEIRKAATKNKITTLSIGKML